MCVPALSPRSSSSFSIQDRWSSVSRLNSSTSIMFLPPRPSSPRQRSTSCSTDDQPSKDRLPRLLHRHYAPDLSMSSHSLATTHSHHDDLPTPPILTHASRTTSTHSTMTSPSTGYSSLLPGSLSSATSESVPSAESKYRSEFGMLIPGSSSPYSAIHGSASSRSSHPISSWSRSATEPSPQMLILQNPGKRHGHASHRPFTAPNSPSILPSGTNNPADHHARSHSRLTVSIKNLFSRRAIHSPSSFSFDSFTTTSPECEASSSSFHVPAVSGKWSMTPRKSRPPDLEISGTVTPAMSSPGYGPNSPIDAHRRYASDAVGKIYSARTGDALPTSQESLDVAFRNAPPIRTRDPKTRNVLRRRPSGSAKLLKGRERGMSSPSLRPNEGDTDLRLPPKDGISRQGGVPFPLTPAGAVVEAYKQQELHRDDASSSPKLSIDDRMSPTVSHDGGYDRDYLKHSPTPFYANFACSSERRLQTGGPDERRHRLETDHQHIFPLPQVESWHQPPMSDPGGRRLSHKLSNRWRKVKGGSVVSDESPSRDKGHSKGRPSLQEIWGNERSLLSTGQSMDGMSNPGDGAWASPSANHARSKSKEDKNEGPKLWRLMRRISTGGLRDKFQSDKAVPPVPAIPKELLKKVDQGDHPSTLRHLPSSLRNRDAPRNIAVARPSVATSSSSPNSFDSAQFFHKTRSARSSVSSYGDAVGVSRASETMLDRHIITPLEQLRLADDPIEGDEPSMTSVPRSPRRSMSVPVCLKTVEEAECDPLPLPLLHRQTSAGESPSSSPSSLSASASPHTLHQSPGVVLGQSRMADGIVSLSPPPRPPRNLSRGGGGSVASSPSSSMVVKQVDGIVGVGIGGGRQIDRMPSGQSDMTARLESPEPRRSQGQDRHRDARTQLTFRELDAPRRPPLSEREKAVIWNDLLARSDKAGGTLHINGAAELMSDSMRLSTHSET